MTRRLALEGIDNFRDYGDYPTASGGRLKGRLLYRSASHGRATENDLAKIATLGITKVVDLRRKTEQTRDPSRRAADFSGAVITSETAASEEDGWIKHIQSSDLTGGAFRDYMIRYYYEAPFDPRHVDLYARYFRALTEIEAPILIHCAAGKDRTGILAALTHHLVGVHPDDAMADYLLTNDPDRVERRLQVVTEAITGFAGKTPPEDAVRIAMGVEPHYLRTAFDEIKTRYGGLDAYLEAALGVDAAARAAITARLVT